MKILKVMKYMDGGTTYIKFCMEKRGSELYFPSIFGRKARPRVTYYDTDEAVELELLIRAGSLLTESF